MTYEMPHISHVTMATEKAVTHKGIWFLSTASVDIRGEKMVVEYPKPAEEPESSLNMWGERERERENNRRRRCKDADPRRMNPGCGRGLQFVTFIKTFKDPAD